MLASRMRPLDIGFLRPVNNGYLEAITFFKKDYQPENDRSLELRLPGGEQDD